ncbi:MAG: hydrogenase iron-sulfur subunit [Methanomicrobia archaeon]|jgi:F420-non-reducing hydrogenase iron-sulfur subunit|nr:hydrogenase iron-sulfur subunit [Methanomicrobia archaeon]
MGEEKEDFEPKIVGFTCNWCTYAGADLAGTSRKKYPPNIRIIRLMCTARIDPMFVLKALLNGADGVFIGGCHPGECHYIKGNFYSRRRIAAMRTILQQLGLDNRVQLHWISASEGDKFANTMKNLAAHIKEVGPNPMKDEIL